MARNRQPYQAPVTADLASAKPAAPLEPTSLSVRKLEPSAPRAALHERLARAVRAAEGGGRMAEASTLNNALVSLQDARYKASQGVVESTEAMALVDEIKAL